MGEKEYLTIANEPGMWIACIIMVLCVAFQAVVFMKKAWKSGQDMGLTQVQMKSAIRASAITTIGPAIAVMIGMISLFPSLGAPFAWLRLSVIGSLSYELLAAETGANAMAVTLGGTGYNVQAFANSVWTATIGAAGWLILCALLTDKFDILRRKVVRGNDALLPVLSVSAMIGAFAYFSSPYIIKKGIPGAVALLVGGGSMILITYLAKKTKKRWMNEWALGISMIVGMLATGLVI